MLPDSADSSSLIFELLGGSLILPEDWERLSTQERNRLLNEPNRDRVLSIMVETGLLTPYQSARIATGNIFGLVLGNFRILERLGAGGMAVVFKAEHIEMRHLVAIKVLQMMRGQDPRLESRFSAEMRIIARLRHPNIVAAMDAGRAYSADPDGPVLWYLVMEYVPGQDLDEYVRFHGPMSIPRACNLAHQIAAALGEIHKFQLVHRDIKPSNILVTPEDQAKLLDFGLSRHVPTRMTQPGTVLGTVDYMSPEQARDASTVDIRADLYGLGGTLFWCLTGELPFNDAGNVTEILIRRLNQQPPSLLAALPGAPAALDAVLRRMMALDPADRYSTPQDAMRALLPFLKPGSHHSLMDTGEIDLPHLMPADTGSRRQRVLLIDDERSIRDLYQSVFQADGLECAEAENGEEGLSIAANFQPDLVLLDVFMPGMTGADVLRQLRASPPSNNLKVIMASGQATADEMARMLSAGADDYLAKPFSVVQLLGRVKAALRLKSAQDRSDRLNQHLLAVNAALERNVSNQDGDIAAIREALVLGLTNLVERRESEGTQHLLRMQRYCRCLAESAMRTPTFANQIDEHFVDMLVSCAPLHDIGKVSLPDHILFKPGKLLPEERILMQAHTTQGAEALANLAQACPTARGFVQMACDIIRHHHERHDGMGYPDRLAGNAIPLAARIVALCDVYDALRCRRSYKPALSHLAALQLMTETSGGQFDPALVRVFLDVAAEFDKIFNELPM